MSHHVRRERIPDPEGESTFGQPPVGTVRYSRTFRTTRDANREAAAWNATGLWRAEVVDGPVPKTTRTPK